MRERIYEILSELIAMKSLTGTAAEREPAEWFASFFRAMPYFRAHGELTGLYEIPNDPCGRAIPYALLLTRLNTLITLNYGGRSVDFHLRVEPSSPETFR